MSRTACIRANECADCKRADAELREDDQDTWYGPRMAAVCKECYAKDVAARRAENRRFGFRCRIVAWDKLAIVPRVEGGQS